MHETTQFWTQRYRKQELGKRWGRRTEEGKEEKEKEEEVEEEEEGKTSHQLLDLSPDSECHFLYSATNACLEQKTNFPQVMSQITCEL